MNLNDPFGRLEHRKNEEYQALRKTLQDAGVTSREGVEEIRGRLRRRALYGSGAALLLALVVALLLPNQIPLVAMFLVVILAWVVSNTVTGHRHISRYIEEELGGRSAPESR
jgi:uncharacterized membrane protein YdbT with pleckstrin-like domain